MSRARRRGGVLALVLAVATLGCAAQRGPKPRPDACPVPALYESQGRITEYIESGKYAEEFTKVVARADAWLAERAPAVQRPAIVLDIDETALSNWQAYRVNHWARILQGDCDLERGPCNIRVWQAMGRSVALPPTLHLVEHARRLGVAVFFITGRPGDLRAVTEQNLREQGFGFAEVIVLPSDKTFTRGADFKAAERQRIAAQGYTILLSMGDQRSDLDGGFAERVFKLPNPVYFLP